MYDNLKTFYAHASRWAFPVLLVMFLWSLITCNNEHEAGKGLAGRLDDLERKTKQIENRNGQLVAQNDQLLTSNAGDLSALTDTIFNLKRDQAKLISQVTSYARIVQEGSFLNKVAVFRDTIREGGKTVIIEQPQDTNLIRVPRPFDYQDSTIRFSGVVGRKALVLDSVTVPNVLHFRTYTEKTGFLNLGRRTMVQALNSNPAIKTKGIASIAVKPLPNWWNRWGKPLAAFLIGGAAVHYAGQ